MINYFSSFLWTPESDQQQGKNNNSDNNKDPSSFDHIADPNESLYFAHNLAFQKSDFRYLASKFHQGLRLQQAKKQEEEEQQKNEKESTTNNKKNSNSSDPLPAIDLCQICAAVPATLFTSELSGVFGSNQKSSSSSPQQNDDSPPQLCFECFILACRALLFPQVAKKQKEQKTVELLRILEEASEADAEKNRKQNAQQQQKKEKEEAEEKKKKQQQQLELPLPLSQQNKPNNSIPCSRCAFPMAPAATYCAACGSPSNATVHCRGCSLRPACSATPKLCTATGRAHLLWSCEACISVNSLDEPCCAFCKTARSWKCPRCDATQRSIPYSSSAGERQCKCCGYKFTSVGQTTMRKFGLDEESVKQSEKAAHERARVTFRLDGKIEKLLCTPPNLHKDFPKLKRVAVRGDGNCAFNAISHCVFGSQEVHMMIRRASVLRLQANKSDYVGIYFENEREFDAYCAGMSTSGTWADNIVLVEAAKVLGLNIHVVSSDADQKWIFSFPAIPPSALHQQKKMKKEQQEQESGKKGNNNNKKEKEQEEEDEEEEEERPHIFLAYSSPVHYDALEFVCSSSASTSLVSFVAPSGAATTGSLLKNLAESFTKEEDEWDAV